VTIRRLISHNLLWQTSTILVATVATLTYGLLVARYLGPSGFGRFSLIAGVIGWIIGLAQGGGANALMLLSAQDRRQAGNLLWPGIAIQLVVGVVAVLVGLPMVWIFSHDIGLLLPAVVYGIANLIYLVTSVIVAIFRGLDRMEWGISMAAASGGMALLMVAVMALDSGFMATIAVGAISQSVVLAVTFPLAWNQLPVKGWHNETASRVWSASVALWGVMLLLSLHWRVGVLAVQGFSGAHELGIYSAAAKLVENLRIVPGYLMLALVPTFVEFGRSDRKKLRNLLQPALQYVTMIAFLLSLILVALSPFLISLLYTLQYKASAQVLSISAIGLAPLFVDWIFLYVLMSLRLERQLVVLYLISILVEAGLDALIVPLRGAKGAAIGFVSGESVAALLGALFTIQAIGAFSWGGLLKIGLVGVLCLILVAVRPAGVNSIQWAAIVCAVNLLGLFCLRVITPSELRTLLRWPPGPSIA